MRFYLLNEADYEKVLASVERDSPGDQILRNTNSMELTKIADAMIEDGFYKVAKETLMLWEEAASRIHLTLVPWQPGMDQLWFAEEAAKRMKDVALNLDADICRFMKEAHRE